MFEIRLRAVLLCLGLWAAPWVEAQPADDPVERTGHAIRDRFVAAIRGCGTEPTFVPGIVVRTDPTMVSYRFADRSVHLPRWSELSPPLQGMMGAWAGAGTMALGPQAMFEEVFDDFLVAHELGHYLEHMSGRMRTLDRTDSETEANQIALAFWSIDPGDAGRLPDRFENLTRFLFALPDPVPTGEDPRSYLEANYGTVAADGAAYSWYQGPFLRTAWARRDDRTFCDWVRINPPIALSDVQRD